MNTTAIVAAAVLGFTWGYQPLDDQTTEYIVQLRQHELQVLADGTHEIVSVIPPEARPVSRVRILVGTEKLPRLSAPPKPLHIPGELTWPAAAYGADGNPGGTDLTSGDVANDPRFARDIVEPLYGRNPLNRSWTNRYDTWTNRWNSVVPPIRPGPADDPTADSGWRPPLALPAPTMPLEPNAGRPDDPYRSHRIPQGTGPTIVSPFDGRSLTSVPDRPDVLSVPPQSERGRGIGFSSSAGETNDTPARDSRWDWSRLAALPELTTYPDKIEVSKKVPEPESSRQPSPSTNKPATERPAADSTPWQTLTLLLGPLAIALAGLNVYQWGIYKSVRRRYLTLLRRTGEV